MSVPVSREITHQKYNRIYGGSGDAGNTEKAYRIRLTLDHADHR